MGISENGGGINDDQIRVSRKQTNGAIIFSPLKNSGDEMTAPIGVAVEWGWGDFIEMESASLGRTSATMATPWRAMVDTTVSSTLKNGGYREDGANLWNH